MLFGFKNYVKLKYRHIPPFLSRVCLVRYLFHLPLQTTTIANEDLEVTESTPISKESLPWYMKNGKRFPKPAKIGPSGRRVTKLWPGEERGADRIENQLMFYPPDPIEPGKIKKVIYQI